jgi:hypothetical protein
LSVEVELGIGGRKFLEAFLVGNVGIHEEQEGV